MTSFSPSILALEDCVTEFFRRSAGQWHSQRRYYTLDPSTPPQEVESEIWIEFLAPDAPELGHLARLHHLSEEETFVCGTHVRWRSTYLGQTRKPSKGETIFGARGSVLYRDRGFATPKPVTALYDFSHPQTMSLKTEYGGSVFEEELKLIGQKYRTRQTIISRTGEEQMIGQYLEKRIELG